MLPRITELLEAKNTIISVFDIDDTLLFSSSKIRYKEPNDSWKECTTDEFAMLRSKLSNNTEYDFSDFRDFSRILVGIKQAKPNVKVLKYLDDAIKQGHKIGVITARGNQDAIWKGLSSFLLYKNKKGELVPLPPGQFNKKYVFAVNDKNTLKSFQAMGTSGSETDPSDIKSFILKHIFGNTMGFTTIYFYDDDAGNIEAVDNLKDSRIKAIKV